MLEKVIDRRNSESVMGLGDHLEDLRKRVLYAALGILPIFIVSLLYGSRLLTAIITPASRALRAEGQPDGMQVTGVMEGFSAYLYIAFLVTVTVGAPWILYQLWKFVAPGLYSNERRFAYVLAPLSVVLTASGILLMYFVMLPLALRFLIGFSAGVGVEAVPQLPLPPGVTLASVPILASDPATVHVGDMWINRDLQELRFCIGGTKVEDSVVVKVAEANGISTEGIAPSGVSPESTLGPPAAPASKTAAGISTDVVSNPVILGSPLRVHSLVTVQPKLDQYIDLFVNLTLLFAITFQTPVVILLLGWIGLVTTKQLRAWRKFALAGSIIIAAMVSPTGDPGSLAILQIPMYLLYELSIFLLWLLPASRVAGKSRRRGGGDSDAKPNDAVGP
ncbi:hypothetical protein BH11PLA1_BH11PLA1_23270 [soil metagenome]